MRYSLIIGVHSIHRIRKDHDQGDKGMKKLFKAIRNGAAETVKELIEKKPELVNCTAKQPPKKDDGQSPLQVALKTGHTDIASFLIDHGADVNFIETESCNAWKAPAVHDAINCAVMFCRWNTDDPTFGFRVFSTKERAENGLAVLKQMIEHGADVNALDSYGNSGLNRFALQAKQILPAYNYAEHRESEGRRFTPELHEDLAKVLRALKDAGGDPLYKAPNLGYSVREFCSEGSIAVLFDEVFGS